MHGERKTIIQELVAELERKEVQREKIKRAILEDVGKIISRVQNINLGGLNRTILLKKIQN